MTTLKMMTVTYPKLRLQPADAAKLRGFFAADEPGQDLLHNHAGDKLLYRYPLVQYKVVGERPTIVALGEAAGPVHRKVMEIDTLLLGERRYPAESLDIGLDTHPIGWTPQPHRYRFVTPWFCLNQKNHRDYLAADQSGRQALLCSILVGNLLSLSKGLGLTVSDRLVAEARLNACDIRFKGEPMQGFTGEFWVNYALPPLLGIGKAVSRGFGTVMPQTLA